MNKQSVSRTAHPPLKIFYREISEIYLLKKKLLVTSLLLHSKEFYVKTEVL